ncbi:hypothetical protein [Sphingobium mellinum]|uniref:hypothetical protein n=1 Tax=Sphingobium mellinum TaxID=1387166 RepID=UPI0030ECB725
MPVTPGPVQILDTPGAVADITSHHLTTNLLLQVSSDATTSLCRLAQLRARPVT